nr:restriction endonuclease [uncultured Ralstonia sp.]
MTTLPTWEAFMVPVLQVLSDGKTQTLRELKKRVGDHAGLDEAQRNVLLPSGEAMAANRIGWAISYLTRVDALACPSRAHYDITAFGSQFLAEHPHGITEADLRKVAKAGNEWWLRSGSAESSSPGALEKTDSALDPDEQIAHGINRIHEDVAYQLLTRLQANDPAFFEDAVVKLLLAMGYGGATGSGTVTSLTNDGGIDGVIDQDILGLNRVYIQAKRYASHNPVQRPELQGFVGALSGKANNGVFITTSRFSTGAIEYAASAQTRVILIDGKRLTELMIRYGVGVQTKRTVNIVEIDEDFFS